MLRNDESIGNILPLPPIHRLSLGLTIRKGETFSAGKTNPDEIIKTVRREVGHHLHDRLIRKLVEQRLEVTNERH